jgi:hypothetical protein
VKVGSFQKCADGAIDAFAKGLGKPYYPNWADLVPMDDNKGWGADDAGWRKQADGIISDFEDCAGVKIDCDATDIASLGKQTLSDFSDYLVETAEHASALFAAHMAISNLKQVRKRHRKKGIRAKVLVLE